MHVFRLRGHKGPITTLHHIPHPTIPSSSHPGYILSTSKDTFLKLWDLSTQHCIQTVVCGRGEVVSCAIRFVEGLFPSKEEQAKGDENMIVDGQDEIGDGQNRDGWVIITGGSDGNLLSWTVSSQSLSTGLTSDANGTLLSLINPLGPLTISGTTISLTNSIQSLSFHPNPRIPLLFMQTTDKSVTVLRIRSEEELEAKKARRRKREREKATKKAKGGVTSNGGEDMEVDGEGADEKSNGTWVDRITDWCIIRAGGKIRSVSLVETETGMETAGLSILFSLTNNSLETFSIPSPPIPGSSSSSKTKSARAIKNQSSSGQIESTRTHVLELQGHRNDPRALAISSDDQVLASASNGSLKIWNLKTTACIRTMECGYAICLLFLPDNRHVVVGTKTGELELFDIAASTLIETIKAHEGPVWSMDIKADRGGIVTGSADKDVKFWELRESEVAGVGSKITTRLGEERVVSLLSSALCWREICHLLTLTDLL